MLMNLYATVTQACEVLWILIYTFRKWPFSLWLNFWATNKDEAIVDLGGIKLTIMTKNIFAKSADISMAYECIVRDDYQLKNLSIADRSVIIDIGGHIGSFSLAAAMKFPKAEILCFEPSPSSYQILKKNIGLNKLRNISTFNKAVSSTEGQILFYIDSINSAANSIYNTNGREVKVASVTLEKIFENNKIRKCAFAKMDCEGAEYDILLNAPGEVLRKIEAIAIEHHDTKHFGIENKDYNVKNLIRKLESLGFKCTLKKMKHYQGLLAARR